MVGYRTGVEWNPPATLPGVLRDAGYHTHLVGRSMHQHPPRRRFGFDHMVVEAEYKDWTTRMDPYGAGTWIIGGNDYTTACPWPYEEYLHHTNWSVDRAIEFLDRRDPSMPYFLCLGFLAAHPPLQPPAFYMEKYVRTGVPEPYIGSWEQRPSSGIGYLARGPEADLTGDQLTQIRAAYYGMITHVDDQLKRLLHHVQTVRGDEDTIIVFTADHGELLGDHYRLRKSLPYEGSAGIPMLISAPPRFGLEAGSTVDAPVCLEDIMPTLLDLAEIETPESVEGVSLVPSMRGESAWPRPYLHIEHSPRHQSLTDGREKYVWFVKDGRELFFDLRSDPHELENLADDPGTGSRIAEWRRRLIEELVGRPEGFTDGASLIPGRAYPPYIDRRETV